MFVLLSFPYVGSAGFCVAWYVRFVKSFPYVGSDGPCVALYVWLSFPYVGSARSMCGFVCVFCEAFRM
jgi:hypothetical protein